MEEVEEVEEEEVKGCTRKYLNGRSDTSNGLFGPVNDPFGRESGSWSHPVTTTGVKTRSS